MSTALDDTWYAGADEHNAQQINASDYEAFGGMDLSALTDPTTKASSAYGQLSTDLFYDTTVLPPFLKSAKLSSSAPGSDNTPVFSRQQDIKLPVKDPMSKFAQLAKEGSDALRRFRKEEAQKKANIEAMDTSKSTTNALLRQVELQRGNATMTEEERDQLRRQLRIERLRNATKEERDQLEAEERAEESKQAKQQGSMRAIDGAGIPSTASADEKARYYENLRESLAASRQRLPVYRCRKALMKYISENQVCVIEGETGSGKTTQLVQYLYEGGYADGDRGMIGCTQPRKVAAVGVAKRVADEVGCELGTTVGYAIRLEDRSSAETKIKFMTEGLLLREVIHDPHVNKYSVIVLDEAHERSVNTDILLGILKGVVRIRSDLKIIVTSATMNTEKFSNFFYGANIFKIAGKVFPVDVVYEPPTSLVKPDYIEDVVTKICEIHLATPLVILPSAEDENSDAGTSDHMLGTKRPREGEAQPQSDDHVEGTGADILVFLPGKEEIVTVVAMVREKLGDRAKRHLDSLWLIPLYSELPPSEQLKALLPTPDGKRKCVVSTNVAETSLTIDGVRFVIDSGFMKTNVYRPKIGMNTLLTYPISQAEANQRKGRAGRTARGVCYRLYGEDQFRDEMLLSPVPEIQRSSIDNVILLLKSIGVDNLLLFDFIDSPPEATIRDSLYKLWLLGALDQKGSVTNDGRLMLEFPVEPSLAKMLLISTQPQYKCSEEMLCIAAMMSVETRSLFITPPGKEEASRQERSKFNVANSDHLTLLNIFSQFLGSGKSESWCQANYLDSRTLRRAVDIRSQFADRMRATQLPITPKSPSIDAVSERLRQVLVHGYISQIAKRVKWNEYESLASFVTCFTNPKSAIVESGGMPEYCLYHEFLQTTKEYMCVVTEVQPEWVIAAAKGVIREKGTPYIELPDPVTAPPTKSTTSLLPAPSRAPSAISSVTPIGTSVGGLSSTNTTASSSHTVGAAKSVPPKPSALELQRLKLMKQKKTIL